MTASKLVNTHTEAEKLYKKRVLCNASRNYDQEFDIKDAGQNYRYRYYFLIQRTIPWIMFVPVAQDK